jgi:hypothetical protein
MSLQLTFANTQMKELTQPGNQSKFQILKDAFNSANFPATINDFEDFKEKESERKIKCVQATPDVPNTIHSVLIARFSKVIDGSPSNGPLFPSEEDRIVEKLIFGQPHWLRHNKYFNLFEMHSSNTDLVIRLPKNDSGLFSDIGDEISIFVRKQSNYMPFKVQKIAEENGPLFPESEGKVFYYGYCYNK